MRHDKVYSDVICDVSLPKSLLSGLWEITKYLSLIDAFCVLSISWNCAMM